MGRMRRTIGVAVATSALLLAACGSDDGDSTIEGDPDDTTTTVPADESTTSSLPEPLGSQLDPYTSTATSLVDVPDDLPDGYYFGYITTLIAGHNEVVGQFDLAELLTGEAAEEAAVAAGEEPMDFFVKNDNDKLRPIQVHPEAIVRDVDYDNCCTASGTTVAQFVADRDADGEERTAVAIVVKDGIVTSIEELYFP